MSKITTVKSNSNQLKVTYDVSKFLLGGNEFVDIDITTTSSEVALLEGMVMGKIAATGLIVPCDKDATDGSQIPVGIVVEDYTVPVSTTEAITLVNKGKVAESKLNFLDTETLETLIGPANNQRSYRDYLNDLGLILQGGTELTNVN